ncbi:MAG: hypothetical protein MUP57_02725 [Clostridia bacterium]|nr:hypothetical protein [Clostridia bacterium]
MKHVSLLPPEIKIQRLTRHKKQRYFLALIIVLIVVVAVNAFFLISSILVRENLKSLQYERSVVDNQAASLQEYEELYQLLSRTENLVNDAMGTVPLWSVLLSDISHTLPIGTQLSDLRIDYSDQSGTVTMRGWVYDHSSLAGMLDQLFTIEQMDQILCRVSTELNYQGREVVQFLVDSILLTGPGFLPDNESGE